MAVVGYGRTAEDIDPADRGAGKGIRQKPIHNDPGAGPHGGKIRDVRAGAAADRRRIEIMMP